MSSTACYNWWKLSAVSALLADWVLARTPELQLRKGVLVTLQRATLRRAGQPLDIVLWLL